MNSQIALIQNIDALLPQTHVVYVVIEMDAYLMPNPLQKVKKPINVSPEVNLSLMHLQHCLNALNC